MKTENFETVCEDGVKLKGIRFIPEHPKAVIQFNCGTATNLASVQISQTVDLYFVRPVRGQSR